MKKREPPSSNPKFRQIISLDQAAKAKRWQSAKVLGLDSAGMSWVKARVPDETSVVFAFANHMCNIV